MKKTALVLAASVLAATMLSGCGSKGVEVDIENLPTYEELAAKEYEDDAYVSNLKLDKMVTLGEYKGLEVSVEKVHVDEAEVEDYINGQVEANPFEVEITDRAVEEGDTVNIDYIGIWNGVEFEGGTAQDQNLVIGSDTFIDGFEDGVIGMNIGEVKHLELTFPEEYHSEELAGQDVIFTVTLNKIITEEPAELSDEWVALQEIEGVATVDEYRDYVYNMYLESDQARFDNQVRNSLLTQVMENSEYKGNYDAMWERYFDATLANIQYQILYYGMDLETFAMLSGGTDLQGLVDELLASAEAGVKETMTTQAIANAEGIKVTDEAVQAELETLAQYYGFASAEEYTAVAGDITDNAEFTELMITELVMDFLADNAVITETEPVEETESETAE